MVDIKPENIYKKLSFRKFIFALNDLRFFVGAIYCWEMAEKFVTGYVAPLKTVPSKIHHFPTLFLCQLF